MTEESDKWYTHTQNWSGGIEQDLRFKNANELNWFTMGSTEENTDLNGNKTHRSWVDITNFYWFNRFTKDIYMIYNLPVGNGPIIANTAHLTKMTVLYLAADDWEHGLYTHEMIQRGGYILRLETTHGETLNIGLIATEAFGDHNTDMAINTRSCFIRTTSSSAPTMFLKPYDQNPHSHEPGGNLPHGHDHNPAILCTNLNTMATDIPDRIASQEPGYYQVKYDVDSAPDSMIQGFNDSALLTKEMFDANREILHFKEFYGVRYGIPTEYYVMATTFRLPATDRLQTITDMKIIRPRYGHKYFNDMDRTLFDEGGLILKVSYTDADVLTDEHVLFQLIVKSSQGFYIKKTDNSYVQFAALPDFT